MICKPIAKIAVEKAAYSFDREFDYLIPPHLASDCAVGKRVLVPFGRGDRRRQGIVTSILSGESNEGLKEIVCVLDSEPVMSESLLSVARFMKEHCFCTLYEAVKAMLPAGINYRVTTVYGVRQSELSVALDGRSAGSATRSSRWRPSCPVSTFPP